MEISEVRRHLSETIERAKRAAADRRTQVDEASREFVVFLEQVAVPLFRQVANVLKAEGYPFDVFTPGGSVRLMSETNADDFIELTLDTTGEEPMRHGPQPPRRAAGGSSNRSGRSAKAPVRNLTEEEVLGFLVEGAGTVRGEIETESESESDAARLSPGEALDADVSMPCRLSSARKPGRSTARRYASRTSTAPLCTNPTSASLSGTIPCAPSAFDGHRQLRCLALGDRRSARPACSAALRAPPHGRRRSSEQHLRDDAAQILGQRQLHLPPVLGRIEIDDAIDRPGGGVRGKPADDELARTPPLRARRSSAPPVRSSSRTSTSGSSRSAARAAASMSSSPPRTSRWLMNEPPRSWTMLISRLDGDHVVAARPVDQIDERRHHRPLAARARTGDEHQPFRLDRQRLDLARQAELLGRSRRGPASGGTRRPARDDRGSSCNGRGRRPSRSQIHSLAAPVRSASWLRSGISVSSSDSTSFASEHRLAVERLHLAVHADRRPRVRREIQRRRAAGGRQTQQPVEAGQRRARRPAAAAHPTGSGCGTSAARRRAAAADAHGEGSADAERQRLAERRSAGGMGARCAPRARQRRRWRDTAAATDADGARRSTAARAALGRWRGDVGGGGDGDAAARRHDRRRGRGGRWRRLTAAATTTRAGGATGAAAVQRDSGRHRDATGGGTTGATGGGGGATLRRRRCETGGAGGHGGCNCVDAAQSSSARAPARPDGCCERRRRQRSARHDDGGAAPGRFQLVVDLPAFVVRRRVLTRPELLGVGQPRNRRQSDASTDRRRDN